MPFLHLKGRFGVVRDFARALYRSQDLPYRAVRRVIYCLLVLTALGHLVKLFVFAATPLARYGSDITQDYVMGRGILNGIDPRLPLPELVKLLFDDDPGNVLPAPSPHSPLAVLLFIPFSLLPLSIAHQLWVLFSAGCAFVAFFVLGDLVRVRSRWMSAILWTSLSILSYPGHDDLFYGQWNFPQLLTLSLFLSAYHRGRYITSAACLAFSLALRPVLVPLCLYSVIVTTGVFRGAFVLASVAIALALLSVLGVEAIFSYPSTVRDSVLLWGGHWNNISLRSFVANLAVPQSGELYQKFIVPILSVPLSKGYVAVGTALTASVLVASLWKAKGREPLYAMLSLLVVSPVLSPLAWHHYLTFLFVPLFLDGQRLMRQPGIRSRLALGAMMLPLVYPAYALFHCTAFDGFADLPTAVPISWMGKCVHPVLTLSVVLAWALYPLPKRVCGKNLSKGYDGSCP